MCRCMSKIFDFVCVCEWCALFLVFVMQVCIHLIVNCSFWSLCLLCVDEYFYIQFELVSLCVVGKKMCVCVCVCVCFVSVLPGADSQGLRADLARVSCQLSVVPICSCDWLKSYVNNRSLCIHVCLSVRLSLCLSVSLSVPPPVHHQDADTDFSPVDDFLPIFMNQ